MARCQLLTIATAGVYAAMAEDHRNAHEEYCDRWGFDYRTVEVPAGRADAVYWQKPAAILDALEADEAPDFLAYLDADAIVVDSNVDLRTAVPDGGIVGAVVHPYAEYDREFHVNAGALYFRRSRQGVKFVAEWLSLSGSGLAEQEAFNRLVMEGPIAYRTGFILLGTEWNTSIHNQRCKRPIVAAWHGWESPERRRAAMRDYMRARGLPL